MATTRIRRLLLVLPLALPLGCSQNAEPEHPVVLIGVDGLSWRVAKPLLAAGEMPNLRRLIERGTSGYLYTIKPALSPAIWTSIATGTEPSYHGIVNFISPRHRVPFTSRSRRGRALWNIAGEYGLKTLCVGWWMTWPAEEISGWMVAPYSAGGQDNVNWKGNLRKDLPDQTWPPELFAEVWPVAERLDDPEEFLTVDREFFGGLEMEELSPLERKLVAQTRWSVRADHAFVEVTKHLLEKPDVRPDLTMVYIGGPDVASHRFWRYRYPDEFEYDIDDASQAAFRSIIARFYRAADRMIGEVLAAAPENANVIVCSDHGFHAEGTEQPLPTGISGHHLDGPPGIVVAAGPDFREGVGAPPILDPQSEAKPMRLGRIYELAPTVMFLLGIPTARLMASPKGGSLLKNAVRPELLKRRSADPTVVSHDDGFRPPEAPKGIDAQMTGDILEWMRQLGYIDSLDGEGTFEEVLPEGG